MRYRVRWLKGGKMHPLLIREATPGAALEFAYTLLVEARPADIWIETEGGRQVANYADIVEEGLAFSACRLPRDPRRPAEIAQMAPNCKSG
jgi:hypothetical protein